ncbi:transglutaminase family protein [Microbacterium sp. NPDC055910]|uniref:transglutaminase-like domain-containing protein n=1 Tax=Microbacterium sp. NPDC055910 TaxID=3345659 RepID=UPI0035E24BD6
MTTPTTTPQRLPLRRWVLDLVAVALLLAVPIAGFWPTFAAPSYLVAAVGAALLGMTIASLGALWRWGALLIAGATVVVYFVFGGALALPHTTVAGVVPTLDTLGGLALGAVTSWKGLLTTVAPVAASDGHLVVPFLLTLVAAVLTTSLALRVARAAWALIPVAAFLVVQIAIGTSEPAAPIVQGIVFAIVAVAWLSLRAAWAHSGAAISLGGDGEGSSRTAATRRILLGGGVVAVAAVIGVATSALAAPEAPRYVLRDVVIPPFDIREYPSPLQGFRALVRDQADDPLFRVSGLPEGARVRIATMDAYSGTVYNVSDEGAGSSSAFRPVRGKMSPDAAGTPVTLRFDMGEWDNVWMPGAGEIAEVQFDGPRADDLRRSAHYNESTRTGVVTGRLTTGDGYTIDTTLPAQPSDERLSGEAFAPVKLPKQEGVPQDLADIAAKAVAEANTPIEQARALESFLADGGFFSHGLEGEVLSRAGHGAERILTLVDADQMIGDDEQYATAMALLAREIGIPARVVMGFYPEEDAAGQAVFTATGDTLHAWVEIAFEDSGWVRFDPTPPEDQVPNDQTTKPRADPKPQVLQPPPPEQEPVDLPIAIPDDRESEDEEKNDLGLLGAILAIGGGVLGVLALLAAPFIVIGVFKAARRRRRRAAERPSDRISGGWDELVDRAVDYGTPVNSGGTRQEDAVTVADAFAESRVATLATRADLEVFGPTDPTPADIDEFWRQVDDIVGGMAAHRSLWQRMRARLNLRSLLAGTRFALPPRTIRARPDGDDRRADTSPPPESE